MDSPLRCPPDERIDCTPPAPFSLTETSRCILCEVMFDCFGGSKSSPVTMRVGAEALGEGEGIAEVVRVGVW